MPRLSFASHTATPLINILSHAPEIAKRWRETNEFLRMGGQIDPDLKEEVRRAVAQQAGCRFCATVNGAPKGEYDDPRVAAAVRFATVAAGQPKGITDDEFNAIKAHFNEAEIVELLAWICYNYGAEMLGAMLDLDEATNAEQKFYAAYLERLKKRADLAV
jgi:alkylhydroperoxidase family enzyme